MSGPFDRSRVQGLVVRSYLYPISKHFLFELGEASAARRFLARWLPQVADGSRDLTCKPEPVLNVALTWRGLLALRAFDGVGSLDEAERAFFFDFREPPDPHSLGDFADGAPATWWNRRFSGEDVHLTLHAHFVTQAVGEAFTEAIRASAEEHGLVELIPTRDGRTPLTGATLEGGGGRELHFGYLDGFSQPLINWDDAPDRPDLVDRRRVLLGDWSEAIQTFPKDPPWSDLVRDSSYMVFRWLYQDVAAFNAYLEANGPKLARPGMTAAEAQELLAAKLLGRWRDGAPLVLSPDRPDPSRALEPFSYAQDGQGLFCPFAAHIRVTNPRDQPFTDPNRRMFPAGPPRVLRRGHSYGPKLTTGTVDDGVDRGIIGLFLCSNINEQVYSLTRWMRQTTFSPVFTDTRGQDPLFGNRHAPLASGAFEIPTENGPIVLRGLPSFVRTQGTLMLILPSMSLLRRLATDLR